MAVNVGTRIRRVTARGQRSRSEPRNHPRAIKALACRSTGTTVPFAPLFNQWGLATLPMARAVRPPFASGWSAPSRASCVTRGDPCSMTSKPLTGRPASWIFSLRHAGILDPMTARLSPATVGRNWARGDFGSSLYNHVETIGSNSCLTGKLAYQEGAWTALRVCAHSAGVNLLYADGHAGFVRETIDPAIWFASGSRNGGELRNDVP